MSFSLARIIPKRGFLPDPLPKEENDIPIVLLHGTMSAPGVFLPIATRLKEEGHRCIGIEYGHRGTDRLEICLLDIVTQLENLLDRHQRFDIVGHSLGGLMALRVANLPQFAGRVRTLVGLGACFRGQHVAWNPLVRSIVTALAGPSEVQLMCDGFADVNIPDGVKVVSIVSTGDTMVKQESSRLGDVRLVEGIGHGFLTTLDEDVAQAIRDGEADPHDHIAPSEATPANSGQDRSTTSYKPSDQVRQD